MTTLRLSERLILAYFCYVAVVAQFLLPNPAWAWGIALGAALVLSVLSRTNNIVRDIAPLAFTLVAYREMNLFRVLPHDGHLENAWIVWDRWLLDTLHGRAVIESAGAIVPLYLEFCYLIVYAVSLAGLALVLRHGRRADMDRFWIAYLAGTLGAYALFPYFPSDPPRTVFPGLDNPNIFTLPRHVNLAIVSGAGIHSSVFPSAHVSSALSAAFGLLATLPHRPWIGRAMAIYALSVAVATVYGRYHYSADATAGIVISLVAIPALRYAGRSTRGMQAPN